MNIEYKVKVFSSLTEKNSITEKVNNDMNQFNPFPHNDTF